ncbi:MAG: hypothetical protein Q8S57_05470 [Methanoregula sp.]|nr:hypothetical protein [Methanoregula sp.]
MDYQSNIRSILQGDIPVGMQPAMQWQSVKLRQGVLYGEVSSHQLFQSGSAQKIPIKVMVKFFNQSLIDPDRFFKRDRDRDEKFPNKV